jgi:hypothetical protein
MPSAREATSRAGGPEFPKVTFAGQRTAQDNIGKAEQLPWLVL